MATTEHLLRFPLKHASMTPVVWNHARKNLPQKARRVPLLSLAEFQQRIPTALVQKKAMGCQAGSLQDPVMQLFRQLDTSSWNKAWWSRYRHTDPSALYTRNLIDTDHETYSLLLLCWNPGKESVIHDHPGDGCWVKVLDGAIRECRYRHVQDDDRREGGGCSPLYCYQDITAGTDTVMYIDDSEGYHKIGNPEQRVAATIHLYSPPVQQCRTWKSELDLVPELANMTNYSEFGRKI